MNKFWSWVKDEAGNESELLLEGVIAQTSWWGDEVTPKAFKDELKKHTGDITVRINSPGGDVFAGVSIYNALVEHDGKVTVKVEALAASAASFIAMAGEDIIMLPGSMMMIHNPWTFAVGDKDELAKVVEMLEKTGDSIASIYVARTGKSEEEIADLLAAETWMTAQEAVDLGFATEAVEPKKPSVSDSIKNALAYAGTVRNAVMQPAMSIKEKAEAKEVEAINDSVTTKNPAKDSAEEPKTPADSQATDDKETVEKTETVDKAEPTVEDNKDNSAKDTAMTDLEKAAAAQVIDPKDQANPDAAPKVTNYLSSNASVEAFAEILRANAGKTVADVKAAWKENLVQNGLTDEDYFRLPDPLVTQIETAVKASGIYNLLNHTGLDVFRIDWDDAEAEIDTSRAGGHKKGDTKDEQILDFEKRVIRAQYIYKYLVLNKEDIRENRSSGALMRFVLTELPERVIREIERAVVIGDGRASNNKRKINSFISIKSDVVANNIFATTYEPLPGEAKYDTIVRALEELEAEGDVYLIHKKGYLTDVKLQKNDNGGYVFVPGTNMNEVLEIAGTFKPKWFNDATDPDFDAYAVVLSGYKTVGDNSIESFTNFKLETNENEFLQEVYKGGGLSVIKAAVGIAKAGS